MRKLAIKKLSTRVWLKIVAVILALYFGFLLYSAPSIEEELKIVQNNPLFGLAGADPDKFSQNVEKLEQGIRALSGIYSDPEDKKHISEALHPVEFLKKLPDLERSRRAFIDDSSLRNRIAYRQKLKQTAEAYEKSAMAYRDALRSLPQNSGLEIYNYIHSAASFSGMMGISDDLLANAKLLKNEVYKGKIARSSSIVKWSSSLAEFLISENDQENLAFIREFIASQDGLQIVSPALEVPTDCFGSSGKPDFFYAVQLRNELVPLYFKPQYFHYIQARFADARYYLPLKNAGFDYYWQPEFNLYTCPDLTYQTEVLTLQKILELLGQRPLAGNLFPQIPEITAVHDGILRFRTQDPLRRSTQIELFNNLELLFSLYTKVELESILGTEETGLLAEILLLSRQKTGYLEEIVARGARLTFNLPEMMRRLPRPLEVKELLIMRSYPSIYFMPFNSSVWRKDVPLQFLESGASRYYKNRSEVEKIYGREKLLNLMDLSFRLIRQ